MDCGICTLKLLSKNELVKFIQKIGHYQAARIIEDHDIDGEKILELNENDVSNWHLSETEEVLLWKCIYQLKLNHVTGSDSQQLRKKPVKPRRTVPSQKYFKYRPFRKQNSDVSDYVSANNQKDTPILSNILSSASTDFETDNYDDYILLPSTLKNSNTITRRIKKYLSYPIIKNEGYDELKDISSSYIELCDIAAVELNDNCKKNATELYEEVPSLKPKKKVKSLKFNIKFCCFSCGFNYNRES